METPFQFTQQQTTCFYQQLVSPTNKETGLYIESSYFASFELQRSRSESSIPSNMCSTQNLYIGFCESLGNSEDSSNLSPFPAGIWSQLVYPPPCDWVLQPGPGRADLKMICSYLFVYTPMKSSNMFPKVWSWEFWWYQWYNQIISSSTNWSWRPEIHGFETSFTQACIHWFCKLTSLFCPAWNIEWDRWKLEKMFCFRRVAFLV